MQTLNENSLFVCMHESVAKSPAFTEILKTLPSPQKLAVRLDDRLPCELTIEGDEAVLKTATTSLKADLELILFSESIRRLSSQAYEDSASLIAELARLAVQGHIRLRRHCSVIELKQKGYLSAATKLGLQTLETTPTHFVFEMLSHRFSFFQPLVVAPTELFLKKLRNFVQK